MTPQKELQALGLSKREARALRHAGQQRWKDAYRDPEFRKANPIVRLRKPTRPQGKGEKP